MSDSGTDTAWRRGEGSGEAAIQAAIFAYSNIVAGFPRASRRAESLRSRRAPRIGAVGVDVDLPIVRQHQRSANHLGALLDIVRLLLEPSRKRVDPPRPVPPGELS
jgi:hypothetical protein